MKKQADRDRIAEEAVGQRHGAHRPSPVRSRRCRRRKRPGGSQHRRGPRRALRRKPRSPSASELGMPIPTLRARRDIRRGRSVSKSQPGASLTRASAATASDQERFLTVVVSCALGYLAAVLFHSRIDARFGTISGPFQITKPPQGDKHPRGFVTSAVLKTITEHPQGMTTAEITAELGAQGIGPQSIAIALGALVQAEKVSSQRREGKYFPTAAEVPTAPDQPSS